MPEWLYEAGPNSGLVFLLVTVIMGGLAAVVTGRALAQTWRPVWQVPFYMVLLALGVRFIHFAIFDEVLLSARNYTVDLVVLTLMSFAGFRTARSRQMTEQYGWDGASRSDA